MTRSPKGDDGFTLTELLLVMVLTGIVGSIVLAAVTTSLHQQTKVQDRNDALAQARTALQRIDRDVRSANPLKCASATQLVLAEVGSTTTYVTYSVIAQSATRNEIVVDRAAPTSCSAAVTPTSRTVLLTNLVNTTTNPIFNFSSGTVTVNVQVQPPSLGQPVVLSDNGVDLRNPA